MGSPEKHEKNVKKNMPEGKGALKHFSQNVTENVAATLLMGRERHGAPGGQHQAAIPAHPGPPEHHKAGSHPGPPTQLPARLCPTSPPFQLSSRLDSRFCSRPPCPLCFASRFHSPSLEHGFSCFISCF